MRVLVVVVLVVVVVTGENKVNSSLSKALARLEFDEKELDPSPVSFFIHGNF